MPNICSLHFGCCFWPPTLSGSTVFTLFAGFAKILKRTISWQVRAKSCGVLCIITCHYRHPKFGDLLYILGNEIVSKYNRTNQMKNDSTFALIIDYVLNKLFIPNISLLTCTTVVWKSCGVLCVIICHYGPGKCVVVAGCLMYLDQNCIICRQFWCFVYVVGGTEGISCVISGAILRLAPLNYTPERK